MFVVVVSFVGVVPEVEKFLAEGEHGGLGVADDDDEEGRDVGREVAGGEHAAACQQKRYFVIWGLECWFQP